MKPSHLIFAALVLAPAAAAAQPSAQPPPARYGYTPTTAAPTTAGGFHDRQGRMMLGFSLGLGGMKIGDEEVQCTNCNYDPIAGEFDFHIGGMMSPRFGLMLEVQGNAQTVAENTFGATSLVQATAMVAAQYWLTPQLWIKGGIGGASLGYSYSDDFNSNADQSEELAQGGAVMAGVGYELLSARNFSIDAQARFIQGSYKDGQDVTSGSLGVGFNWF